MQVSTILHANISINRQKLAGEVDQESTQSAMRDVDGSPYWPAFLLTTAFCVTRILNRQKIAVR